MAIKTFEDFVCQNKNKNEDLINEDLIYNIRNSERLEEFILDALSIFECKHVKITGYELITDESQFETENVNLRYIKNKNNRKYDKRMPIDKSRYDLLRVHYLLKGKVKSKDKSKDDYYAEEEYTQDLLLFKRVKNYYYIIGGNRFYPLYQMVDNSTYTTKDYLIMKTLLSSITLKRSTEQLISITGQQYYVPGYLLCIFKNKINPLLMYMATMGYQNTLRYMEMADIIRVDSFRKYDEDTEYCFPTTGGLYVKVIKYFFDNDLFVKNMVFSLVDVTDICESIHDLNSLDFWVCKLGSVIMNSKYTKDDKLYKKGKSIILSFSRILDKITMKVTRLEEYNKSSPFALLRWMLRNFNALKAKDNMDLKNKRIRMAEYIAGYVIRRISPRMHKFTSINSKDVTMKDVKTLVSMDQDFIVKTVLSSKKSLLRYDNSTNDQDLFIALKYTIKGLGAIGENSSNTVNIKYRGIDPSYVGRLDLNYSSNSDPRILGC